ncbi:MAG: hypothetical protein KDI48_16540 [Xanthomonadales bacterium]|nr:hypothetical protein [Xanthomonadales bacterium]
MIRLDQLRHLPLFVLFELAPSAWTQTGLARLQRALPRPGAEEIGLLCAHDLARIAPLVADAGVSMVGASFDPAEVLRPRWPLAQVLTEQYRLSLAGEGFARRLLFFGAVDGALPDRRLQPDPKHPASPWRVLPLALIGEGEAIERIERDLEAHLLESGECAPPVATALASWFGVEIAHARHLTALDLLAVLRAQYLQADGELLADLLEAALLRPDRAVFLQDPSGLHCAWDGQRVRLQWTPAPAQPCAGWRGRLARGRQLQQGLALHGIETIWVSCADQPAEALLGGTELGDCVEERIGDNAVARWQLHQDDQLGLWRVEGLDAADAVCCRLYPLSEQGLQRLDTLLGELPRQILTGNNG